jgi:ABC-type multidrug transport system fused ATPase/permease subunit
LAFFVASIARSFVIATIVLGSATNLHNAMTEKVIRSNILFFDSNPMGRIQTRFSKDIGIVDGVFSFLFPMIAFGGFRFLSVFIAICVVNYWLLFGVAFSLLYLVYVWKKS